MRKIILASASPRRKELLQKAGVIFTVHPAEGEEKITSQKPEEAVQELAENKALSVAGTIHEAQEGTLILGADTIVVFEDRILGKPADEEDAARTLKMLQGNTHQVYTGVCALICSGGKWIAHTFYESTDVTFYPVSDQEIHEYILNGEPMDKAGSYGIQGMFGIYVKGICGDYNNVVGLPTARLFYEMKKLGIDLKG